MAAEQLILSFESRPHFKGTCYAGKETGSEKTCPPF